MRVFIFILLWGAGCNVQAEVLGDTQPVVAPTRYSFSDLPLSPITGTQLIKDWPTSRGLVEMQMKGFGPTMGPCGSNVYSPNRWYVKADNQIETFDDFADRGTACRLLAVFQEWRSHCDINNEATNGCTIFRGDISHRTDPGFNGEHEEHRDGNCIDFRVMRKGPAVDNKLSTWEPEYDREKTAEFVSVLKKFGSERIYLLDRQLCTRKDLGLQCRENHNNHIHICFPKDPQGKYCEDFKYFPNICGNRGLN